jgi:hypothetical protein
MAGVCYRVVVSVGSVDRAASDDGFVYFDFVGCDGIPQTIGYNVNKTSFDTGYCMDSSYFYECYIYVGGVKTACTTSSIASGVSCSGSEPVEPPPVVVPPAYGKKYTLSAISKSGLTYTCEIWEKAWTGAVYPINTGANPFVLNCLASSDDPFQPILPTTFTISADFTDFTGPWPDFLTTDDRKYHVKFYAQGTTYLVWRGYILMDSLTIPFTTGRNFIDIYCVDGLGLLKSIPYLPSTGDINVNENLLKIINNCLQYLLYPGGYNINHAINYYTAAMVNTTSYLRQCYIIPNTWTTGQDTFATCYDVLETICTAHGAQFFQSGGEWWITSVNERASDTLRVFRTNEDLIADTLSTVNITRTIKPYINDTLTPFYFINNSQAKILAKGYQSIVITGDINYPENTIDNGSMLKLSGSYPANWTITLGSGGGSMIYNTSGTVPVWDLFAGSSATLAAANSCGYINQGDVINLSFIYQALGTSGIALEVEIKIDVGAGNNYKWKRVLGSDPSWKYNFASGYYELTGSDGKQTTQTIETISAPASGTLYVTFKVSSVLTASISNVKRTGSIFYKKRIVFNQNSTSPYKKEAITKLGAAQPYLNTSQAQCLLTTSNNALVNFSRFSGGGTYSSMINLLLSQYYNIFYKPAINLSFTHYQLFTGSVIIGLIQNFAVTDPPGNVSINTARFVPGACTIDYINNTISGTGLQISNTEIAFTQKDTYTL